MDETVSRCIGCGVFLYGCDYRARARESGELRGCKSGMCNGIKQPTRFIRIARRFALAYGEHDENFDGDNRFTELRQFTGKR
jgi:Fe-S-cluster-containing dehydrogenase component